MQLQGLTDVKARLEALPRRMTRKVLEQGLLAGAKPMVEEARSLAPVLQEPTPRRKPGTVKKRIRALRAKPIRGMTATVTIGVRGLTRAAVRNYKLKRLRKEVSKGKGRDVLRAIKGAYNPNDPFYWRYVEKGTSRMPAQPFLRPAFEAFKKVSSALAAAEFKVAIAQATRKRGL